jgi:hypothetical protein
MMMVRPKALERMVMYSQAKMPNQKLYICPIKPRQILDLRYGICENHKISVERQLLYTIVQRPRAGLI